jgi:hypothetical protein
VAETSIDPARDCPQCPSCKLALGTPIVSAEIERWNGPSKATLFCPSCGEGWIGTTAELAQAEASWAAWTALIITIVGPSGTGKPCRHGCKCPLHARPPAPDVARLQQLARDVIDHFGCSCHFDDLARERCPCGGDGRDKDGQATLEGCWHCQAREALS